MKTRKEKYRTFTPERVEWRNDYMYRVTDFYKTSKYLAYCSTWRFLSRNIIYTTCKQIDGIISGLPVVNNNFNILNKTYFPKFEKYFKSAL